MFASFVENATRTPKKTVLGYLQTKAEKEEDYRRLELNPLSPKIDFYVDLLICATSWASNHRFMLLSKIFQETYYL